MKRLILFAFFLTCAATIHLNAQELRYKDLKSLTERGDFTSYISKDSTLYKVGDTIKIGLPSSEKIFSFIIQDAGLVSGPKYLSVGVSGDNTKILKIKVIGNKRTGYSVILKTTGKSSITNYSIDLENALSVGEIKCSGKTSDEALSELKRAKEKLELGLITPDAYDKIKSELVKYIK